LAVTPFAAANQNIPGIPSFGPIQPVSLCSFTGLHPTPKMTEIFGFTPFGIYCRVCNDHVGSSERMIKLHFESRHGLISRDVVKAFLLIANQEVHRLSRNGNIKSFLVSSPLPGFSCKCGSIFREKKTLIRHCKEVKSCSFSSKDAFPVLLFKTVCGRLVSQETVEQLSSSQPAAKKFDFDKTEKILGKYIRSDEAVGAYTALFHPLFESSTKNSDALLSGMVDCWSKPLAENTELGLKNLLQAAEKWIYTAARRQVEMVPGNLRSALQVFGGQELGEVSQNFLYTFRHKESLVLPEVK
jgi:hypothetical protein